MGKQKKEYQIENDGGITLVALVVTIVVLLILAGITLTYVLGDNGIIKLAQQAKEITDKKIEEEIESIEQIQNWINNNIESSNMEEPKEEIKTMQVEVRGYTGVYDGEEHNEFACFQVTDENGIDITNKVTVEIVRRDLDGKTLDGVSEKVTNVRDRRIIYYTISYAGYHDVVDSTIVEISQKPLTVTTGSASKKYDGTPLTNPNCQLEGLVSVDNSVTVVTIGSQTRIGRSPNGYRLEWGSVIKENYSIIEKLGFLVVVS